MYQFFQTYSVLTTVVFKYVTVFLLSRLVYCQLQMQIINVSLAICRHKNEIPWQTAKFTDIPVKTEFPGIPWFSRMWESCRSQDNNSSLHYSGSQRSLDTGNECASD